MLSTAWGGGGSWELSSFLGGDRAAGDLSEQGRDKELHWKVKSLGVTRFWGGRPLSEESAAVVSLWVALCACCVLDGARCSRRL